MDDNKCERCGGIGKNLTGHQNSEGISIFYTCPDCAGSGKAQEGEKKVFIQVELFYGDQSQGSYTQPYDENIEVDDLIPDGLEGLGEGDSYRLTKVLMTEAEHAALPEFTGF